MAYRCFGQAIATMGNGFQQGQSCCIYRSAILEACPATCLRAVLRLAGNFSINYYNLCSQSKIHQLARLLVTLTIHQQRVVFTFHFESLVIHGQWHSHFH